ncbi:MAG TPA: cell division protein ZapA [Bacteroidales bacterium]|jgi:cell division protein ZapA (FtsZ GTPase activity inhibitor)|nr:cell division protein ZapA [Bacteroidales bacterium]
MDEKLSIRVNIADKYYPLKIDRNEEERIRKAAKLINERVLQYKQKYTDKDVLDFLAMTALQNTTRMIELEEKQDVNTLAESIKELTEELEDYIKEE